MTSLRLAVVVATRGRAGEVAVLLDWLARGVRLPDEVVIVGGSPDDWRGAEHAPIAPTTLVAPAPGLPKQRNVGIEHLLSGARPRPDIVFFFDDDFRPHPAWLKAAEATFASDPGVIGLTGTVLRDGAQTAAIGEAEAAELVARWQPLARSADTAVPRLYGCNMAVRAAAFDAGVRFDERLPLYGWLEDLDFSGQLAGKLVVAGDCGGVHLGSKGARVSGRRYGYSQIVNPLYLARKGTCPRILAARLVVQALASNALRSIRSSHPLFDYRGRLLGNAGALADMARGRARPERIVEL